MWCAGSSRSRWLPRELRVTDHAALGALDFLGALDRWVFFAAMLVATGAAVFHFMVSRALRVPALDRAAVRLGTWGAALAFLAILGRLPVQVVELYDDASPLFGQIQALVMNTSWGTVWLMQIVLAIALAIAFAAAQRGGRMAWIMAALASIALSATPAFSGHAIGAERLPALAVVADILHVVSAGAWVGAMVSVLAGLGIAFRQREPDEVPAAEMVAAFSKMALVAAPMVLLTGVISAWLHLVTLPALWQSRYGLMLLRKLIFVALLGLLGFWNWRRGTPGLRKSGAVGPIRRTVRLEVLMGLAVLAFTAFLVAMGPPGSE